MVSGWSTRVVRAVALVVLSVGAFACAADTEGASDIAGASDSGGVPDAEAATEPSAAAHVAGAGDALAALAAAMAAGDLDEVVDLATGPARVFFTYQRHHWLAEGADRPPYPNLRLAHGEVEGWSRDRVRFSGPLGYGTQDGAPPRILTDLEFVGDAADGSWRLERFVRNGHPIGEWVSPPQDASPVEVGNLAAEVVALFTDVACNTGSDTGCPEWSRDKVAIAFLVTNGTDGPIEPAPVELPDGTRELAWLETSGGDAEPLFVASTTGLPAGRSSPVVALFGRVGELADGGALHFGLMTEDGERHLLTLPVPPYPHGWDNSP